MIIIGHKLIEAPLFFRVKKRSDIEKTLPNSVIVVNNLFENIDIISYLKENELPFAVEINSLKEALFANSFHASYVLCSLDLAKEVQTLANEYLWDMKVLVTILSESELEIVAKAFIDGVIYKNHIKDI